MMKTVKTLSITACLLTSVVIQAAENYVCTNAGVERSVNVVYQSPSLAVPCEVQYTKDDASQTLWAAQNTEGFCEEQAQIFVAKLKSWGWQCNQEGGSADMAPAEEGMAPTEEDMTPAEGADGN